jgi:hypothetical protein
MPLGRGTARFTYAGLPESTPPAPTSSHPTKPLLLPTPPPTQAPPPGEVAATETPLQSNANRLLRSLTLCQDRTHPLASATQINIEVATLKIL